MAEAARQGTGLIDLRTRLDARMIELDNARRSWWTHWREIADYLLPRRYKWLITANQGNRGSPQNQRIVDNSGTMELRTLANGMMSGITNPGNEWFELDIDGDDNAADDGDVKKWLQACSQAMLRYMAKSNFYTSVNTVYEDLAAFGTASMLIYEDFQDVFRCYNPAVGEFFVSNSFRNEVDTHYRRFTMTVDQVVGQFGFENCDVTVQTLYRSPGSRKAQEVIVCHAIEPNEGYVPGMKGPRGMPFMEYYWLQGATEEKILSRKPFHEKPFMAPRWTQLGNDAYGRSPGMDALGDLKQLQVQTKRLAQAIDKIVNPPLVGDISLKNEPATSLPGGITYVPATSGVGLKPIFEVPPDVTKIESNMDLCRKRIARTFYADLFLSISSLDDVRTATDINARREEKLVQLGPVLERFENEFLDPAVKRVFAIMRRASLAAWAQGQDGILPQPPDKIRGRQISVNYVSMLSEAQKGIATSGVERWLAQIGNLAAVDPTVLDNVDSDAVVDGYGEMLGVPEKFIRSAKDVKKLRAQRQQQQQQQAALQQTLPAVQGAKVLSDTDVGGGQNALQKMLQTQ